MHILKFFGALMHTVLSFLRSYVKRTEVVGIATNGTPRVTWALSTSSRVNRILEMIKNQNFETNSGRVFGGNMVSLFFTRTCRNMKTNN